MIRTLCSLLFVTAVSLHAQTRMEIVRGRVTTAAALPIVDVDVTVRRTTDGQSRSAKTDSAGMYAVAWSDGAGSYLVEVAAAGFTPFRKIVTRLGADSVLTLDVVLMAAETPRSPDTQNAQAAKVSGAPVTQLTTVVTKVDRERPDRHTGSDPGAGAADVVFNPQFASRRLTPDQAGDLNALAGMAPGVLAAAGGFSVLGLGPTQNLVTLNGLAFPSGDVPRDTPTLLHVTTSSYDPAIGWFSGARAGVDMAPGGPFSTRTSHLTGDAPSLQFTDAVGARSGQRYDNLNGSIGGSGQFARDRIAYTYGAQGGRKTLNPATLISADANVLAHSGLAADSATRLLSLLRQLGIPTNVSSGNPSTISDNLSFLGRMDLAPYDWNTLTPAKRTLGITAYGKINRLTGQALTPLATPAHGGESSRAVGALQADYSFYFGNGFLGGFRSGVTFVRATTRPSLAAPNGQVLITSTLPSGTALSDAQFGGNTTLASTSSAWTWESQADVDFYPAGRSIHHVKFTVDSRFDGSSQTTSTNSLGTFDYNSLSDLANNRPVSFSRTIAAPTATAGAWNGFAAVGDIWRAAQDLQIVYGLRLDANAFTRRPTYDARLDSALGVRTDRSPASIGVSPRLGFTYNATVPKWIDRASPLAVVHGGLGAFRNLVDPNLLAASSAATGLTGALRQIGCTGAVVPAANWTSFIADTATVPQQCAGGASTFANVAPNVVTVHPAFRPPTSWRANVGWSSSVGKNIYWIDATYSLNLAQPGTTDLNFSNTPRFTTADEARPIFAGRNSIVPASGLVSPADARLSQSFGRVITTVSDLQSISRQLTVTLRPNVGSWLRKYTGDVGISYTLGSIRSLQRGFDATTFGDPAAKYWSRGDLDARHQFIAGMNFRPYASWNVFLFGHAQSGLPFTPIVGGDVNGDGLMNDRAFVFDPAHADAGVANGLNGLLASSSGRVRDCLARQFGRVAGPASCEGPWSATLNVAAILDGAKLRLPRTTITWNFANVLGGLDLLAHGSNGLKGWGGTPVPDPVLYRVTGFDPATKRFAYQVNPRFGNAGAASTAQRTPFRITLDVSIDIAPALAKQQVDRWLEPGRAGRSGTRLLAPELAQRFARSVPDPYAQLLTQTDSLVLKNDQISALQRADDRFRMRMDSTWRALGATLAALPDNYDSAVAAREVDRAVDDAWEFARLDTQSQLDAILSPVQRGMLAGWAKILYNAKRPLHYRLFITGR